MAHAATYFNPWDHDERHPLLAKSERVVAVPDNDWEDQHMAWLGFSDTLAIGCGCQDCAEAIYEILSECAKRHGLDRLP